MRILPAALAISAVLHGGAIAWVHARRADAVPEPQAARAVTPVIEVEIVPTVTLLPDHTEVPHLASVGNTSGTAAPAHHGTTRISTGHATATETTAPHATTEPAHHSALMTMRHPERPDLQGPSGDFLSTFLANTKPLQPKDVASERMADDVASAKEHLDNPRWIANATAEELAEERARQIAAGEAYTHRELKQDGTGYKATHAGFDAKVDADGTVHVKDKPTFDATDALMRSHGMDPYASYKLKVLDETREERYQIGKRHNRELLARSARLAQKNIDFLWAKTTDVAARKQGLFELWDDCAETGSDELVAGGLAARAVITGTIRARLTGSAAYTADELASLNAHKKSHARFDPYAE